MAQGVIPEPGDASLFPRKHTEEKRPDSCKLISDLCMNIGTRTFKHTHTEGERDIYTGTHTQGWTHTYTYTHGGGEAYIDTDTHTQ